MTALRCISLRHSALAQAKSLTRYQRRWARVQDVRFLATHQASERIVDRYKDKLQQKAKQQGLESISELKEVYKDKIKDYRKKAIVAGATGPLEQSGIGIDSNIPPQSQWMQPPPPPPSSPQPTGPVTSASSAVKPPAIKTLSSFLDVPKTLDLPPHEIESIWRLRHAGSSQSLCAAIPSATFAAISATAKSNPQFILPGLPRQQADGEVSNSPAPEGAPIHFLQWNFTGPDTITVLFTHLAEYKLRGEYAQPHTTMTHHLELARPKGLVLCQGTVMEGRGVTVEEGKWLVMCMQKFYNTYSLEDSQQPNLDDPSGSSKDLKTRRRRLVEKFNNGDESFKIEDLLEEAERMG